MKIILSFLCILCLNTAFSQEIYNDTLFYNTGRERPCHITKYDDQDFVYFDYINSKGQKKTAELKKDQLKYFVIYDNETSEKLFDSRGGGANSTSSKMHKFNDTLYYKSGWDRAVNITESDEYEVKFTYPNKKSGEIKYYSILVKKLNYYVVYDDEDSLIHTTKPDDIGGDFKSDNTDSLFVAKHILSINPFSIPLLGVNMQYTYRFGDNLKYGIRTSGRLISPILTQGFFLGNFGVGFTFLPVNNERFTMTWSATPSLTLAGGEGYFSLPVTIGFIRYFTPKIVLTGNIGMGPAFGNGGLFPWPVPSAHIGIGFQLGEKEMINYQKM